MVVACSFGVRAVYAVYREPALRVGLGRIVGISLQGYLRSGYRLLGLFTQYLTVDIVCVHRCHHNILLYDSSVGNVQA